MRSPILPNRQLSHGVVQPVPAGLLYAEVARLPPECRLLKQGDHELLVARAPQMPALLREIGRLRDLSIGGGGGGTDQDRDVATSDTDYLHLFIWNAANGELVGGCRIGLLGDLLARGGLRRLHASSLCNSGPGVLERLGPALKIGHPFIRTEYQRQATALALLWRGIGAYLVRNPKYKVLFGPVSVSGDDQERLRHHLRFNARILSFNVDASFGHCLDGLILANLRNTDPRVLRRFMGEEGLALYARVP